MTQVFVIPRMSTFGMVFLAGLMAALLVGSGWFFTLRADSLAGAIIGMSVMLPLALVFGWFLYMQGRSSLTLTPVELTLDIPWYGRTIKRSDLRIEEARILDPDDADWGLKWRTNGIGLPSYAVGWFSTKGGAKVLAALTTRQRVLIPTNAKFALLVSVDEPEKLLQALALETD